MKIRTSHVSNSSTSSFLIAGFAKEDVESVEEFRKKYDAIADDGVESYDQWIDENYDIVVGGIWIGMDDDDKTSVGEDEIGAGLCVASVDGGELCDLTQAFAEPEKIISSLKERGVIVKPGAKMRIYAFGTGMS